MKKSTLKHLLSLTLVVCLLFSLTACGSSKKSYAGTYLGQQGSTIILNRDGTCTYTEEDWKNAEDGTWSVKDKVLTISNISRLSYDIYASVENSSTSLLFKADSSHWNDELFVKSK